MRSGTITVSRPLASLHFVFPFCQNQQFATHTLYRLRSGIASVDDWVGLPDEPAQLLDGCNAIITRVRRCHTPAEFTLRGSGVQVLPPYPVRMDAGAGTDPTDADSLASKSVAGAACVVELVHCPPSKKPNGTCGSQ